MIEDKIIESLKSLRTSSSLMNKARSLKSTGLLVSHLLIPPLGPLVPTGLLLSSAKQPASGLHSPSWPRCLKIEQSPTACTPVLVLHRLEVCPSCVVEHCLGLRDTNLAQCGEQVLLPLCMRRGQNISISPTNLNTKMPWQSSFLWELCPLSEGTSWIKFLAAARKTVDKRKIFGTKFSMLTLLIDTILSTSKIKPTLITDHNLTRSNVT